MPLHVFLFSSLIEPTSFIVYLLSYNHAGSTTIKKNPIATNAKSGHFTNLSNFVWAKFTIMNCNIQRTRTLLTSSSQKTMGLCGIFLSKLSSNVNNAGPQ